MTPANDIATIRKIALYVGMPALAVAVLMTYQFGKSMSLLHAVCLGLLTVAGSIIWPYAKHLRATANTNALTFMAIGAMFLSVEFFSHLGYTVGTRVIETETTGVANAVYENNQAAAKDDAANLDLWRGQLKELQDKLPWVATVKADGLRAQLDVAQKEIDLEAARRGCKSKCAMRMKEKADLEQRIASVEQAEDLSRRIEATQRILDGKRSTANTTEFKTSAVVAQTNFVSQIWTGSLEPDKASLTWTQIAIGALVALVSTFLAPVMFTIAFGPLSASEEIDSGIERLKRAAKPVKDASGNMTFNLKDDGIGRRIIENLQRLHSKEALAA